MATKTVKILGHEFRPFNDDDYELFAGAGDNALICELEGCILIANVSEQNEGYYDISEFPDPTEEGPNAPSVEIVYTCQGNICG